MQSAKRSDLLKVIFFSRSEDSLITFCTEVCAKIAIKNIYNLKKKNLFSNCAKNMKKYRFFKLCI